MNISSYKTKFKQRSQNLRTTLGHIVNIQRKGYLQFFTDNWHEQGDLVKLELGPVTIHMAIHPDYVKHVTIESRQKYDKRKSYEMVRKLLLGNGLVSSTGELWQRQRKLMSPFFTPRGIEQYASIMIEDSQNFAQRWNKLAEQGQPVDMIDEMMKITASIILKTMFSVSIDPSALEMKEAVETLIKTSTLRNLAVVKLPLWLPTPQNRKYFASRNFVNTYVQEIIKQRRSMPQKQWPSDLLTRLMTARDDESGKTMDDQQILDEAITIFFAGHETTARTLSFAWYALSQNPQVAEKLQAELDTVLGGREPTLNDLKQLPYTLQIIKETLRLYPAAPIYIRDAVEDDVINNQVIAAGTPVMLSPFLTHRHPDFWPNPEEFDPERWLPEREKAQHPQAYHPFATGQRVCIGNNFSLLESHILLAVLAARFNPRLLAGHKIQLEAVGVLNSKNGIPMFIEKRSANSKLEAHSALSPQSLA